MDVLTAEHDAEDNRSKYLHSQTHIAALEAALALRKAVPAAIRNAQTIKEIAVLEAKLRVARG